MILLCNAADGSIYSSSGTLNAYVRGPVTSHEFESVYSNPQSGSDPNRQKLYAYAKLVFPKQQKYSHRLGSFPKPAARRDEADSGGGGGGVRVREPSLFTCTPSV